MNEWLQFCANPERIPVIAKMIVMYFNIRAHSLSEALSGRMYITRCLRIFLNIRTGLLQFPGVSKGVGRVSEDAVLPDKVVLLVLVVVPTETLQFSGPAGLYPDIDLCPTVPQYSYSTRPANHEEETDFVHHYVWCGLTSGDCIS